MLGLWEQVMSAGTTHGVAWQSNVIPGFRPVGRTVVDPMGLLHWGATTPSQWRPLERASARRGRTRFVQLSLPGERSWSSSSTLISAFSGRAVWIHRGVPLASARHINGHPRWHFILLESLAGLLSPTGRDHRALQRKSAREGLRTAANFCGC